MFGQMETNSYSQTRKLTTIQDMCKYPNDA